MFTVESFSDRFLNISFRYSINKQFRSWFDTHFRYPTLLPCDINFNQKSSNYQWRPDILYTVTRVFYYKNQMISLKIFSKRKYFLPKHLPTFCSNFEYNTIENKLYLYLFLLFLFYKWHLGKKKYEFIRRYITYILQHNVFTTLKKNMLGRINCIYIRHSSIQSLIIVQIDKLNLFLFCDSVCIYWATFHLFYCNVYLGDSKGYVWGFCCIRGITTVLIWFTSPSL